MTHDLVVFLQGVCATAAWAIGLLFFRFWRDNRDGLFLGFALGFWLLASSWTLLGTLSPAAETRPYVYGLRLIAFGFIIGGVIVKNVGARRPGTRPRE